MTNHSHPQGNINGSQSAGQERVLGVGIIGCGNISAAYLKLAPLFRGIEMRACADLNSAASEARAREFGIASRSIEALLASTDIDIIINLTVPAAHFDVSMAILEAGKHVYSEKPLVLELEQGLALQQAATARGLAVGCAPDTFLGGAHQQARDLIDSGRLGTIVGGTCHVMSHGMEHWHPNPDFFFKHGGGPVLDLGPYYIANLINLIGPVKRVAAISAIPSKQRVISSEPRKGQLIEVETPTTIHALLQFHNGATVTLGASWDVWAHRHGNMELYGSEGSIYVPDPNFFGGDVRYTERSGEAQLLQPWDHPFSPPNYPAEAPKFANYRTAGLAEMAQALLQGEEPRCSLSRTLHGIEVMTAILESGETGQFVELQTYCERPPALDSQAARALLCQPH